MLTKATWATSPDSTKSILSMLCENGSTIIYKPLPANGIALRLYIEEGESAQINHLNGFAIYPFPKLQYEPPIVAGIYPYGTAVSPEDFQSFVDFAIGIANS